MSKEVLSQKERYQYLINARNFHYENFNKWMTYFYVAIGALFVGYYNIASQKNMDKEQIILLLLGYVASLFWYWASKGYYFWNINFITLVNNCEEKLGLTKDKRVYFVFANKKTQNNYISPTSGANISTSKIAILFAFIVTIAWNLLLFCKINFLYKLGFDLYCIFAGALGLTLILSIVIPEEFLISKIDHFPDLEIDQKK